MPPESDTRPIGPAHRRVHPPNADPPADGGEPLVALEVSVGRGSTTCGWREATRGAAGARFAVGDRVRAIGDTSVAVVVAVFAKRSGAVRYVTEDEGGHLRIVTTTDLVVG